ncbi:sensor histidine kinase [Neobacillus massiliamazoniensis]|uniref:histidine kinase n=1 Tax=Neobacillus massiliamazoniensis TaxID=1499688 RepID=A0A0U1NVF0_9BACI|nr:sensor histidine kinase [Neobacillus massiliamazoniensis]CRK82004.1 two-component sensor histidine kinase YxjL [Neobacillus massiliamazoniensis]
MKKIKIKPFFKQIIQRAPNRTWTIILSFILLSLLIKNINVNTFPKATPVILIFTIYLAVFWLPNHIWDNTKRIFAVVGIWALTAFFWIAFGESQTSIVLMSFLIGFIAFRLPHKISLILAASVIAVNMVIFLIIEHKTFNEVYTYSMVYLVLYVLFWSTRIKREANEMSARHLKELEEIHVKLKSTHIELQQAHKELEESTVQSLRYAVLEERTRIARDIHDSIGHGLTSIIVQLQALPYMVKAESSKMDNTLQTVLDTARDCLKEIRSVVHQMVIDDEGIGLIALQSLIKRVQEQSGLKVKLTITEQTPQWKTDIFELLYRILQEALTNVIRHAEASDVEVTISEETGNLIMTIMDNGIVTEDTQLLPGFGLSGIQARCQRVGGSCIMQSRKPHGLALIVRIPLHSMQSKGESL